MLRIILSLFLPFFFVTIATCQSNQERSNKPGEIVKTTVQNITLPAPFTTPSVRNSAKVLGWPEGQAPLAPQGFTVTKYADSLDHPRWIYVAPNGDIFVSEANTISDGFAKTNTESGAKGASKNSILLLRDADKNGIPELQKIFLTGLNRPLGMLILGNKFYVANTDALLLFPYEDGQTEMTAAGKKILELPAGGYNNHWTRNLLSSRDGSKIYISVGSGVMWLKMA